jgi:hypothetical protein
MGYACPVCDLPQHDAEHLANHLAMTALTHADDHETWLDDHVADWSEESPESLGDRVAPLAEEVPHETVFEDATGGHDHAGGPGVDVPTGASAGVGAAPDTEATQAAIEAVQRMRAEATGDKDGDGDRTADTDATEEP